MHEGISSQRRPPPLHYRPLHEHRGQCPSRCSSIHAQSCVSSAGSRVSFSWGHARAQGTNISPFALTVSGLVPTYNCVNAPMGVGCKNTLSWKRDVVKRNVSIRGHVPSLFIYSFRVDRFMRGVCTYREPLLNRRHLALQIGLDVP